LRNRGSKGGSDETSLRRNPRERRIGIAVEKERLAVRSIEFSARGGFGFLMCERKSLETRDSYQICLSLINYIIGARRYN